MLLWVICAVLTAFAVAWISRPLLTRMPAGARGSSAAIYRAQLAELGRELGAGEIDPAAAEESRREIGRRLLAADAAEVQAMPPRFHREAHFGLILTAIVPVAALAGYLILGRPDLAGQPLAGRDMNVALQAAPLDEVAEYLFQKLAMDPGHPEGWELLGRTYMRLQRYDEAAAAFGRAVELLGAAAPADLHSAVGEALTLASGGRVTAEARKAFAKALAIDPKEPSARFYMALAKQQDGDAAGALADLEAILAEAPADAPYRTIVEARIAELKAPAAPRDNPDIRAMVDGLAARLAEAPHDLEGWLLLITSYVKLEEPDRARTALATARAEFKAEPEALSALAAKAKELGLEP